MKIWIRAGFISAAMMLMTMPVFAANLVWDRNTESDMKDYQVWACFTANCVVAKTQAALQGTVAQPAVGVQPTFPIDLVDKEGAVAVSARDITLNESGLSVAVPFDRKAPSIPMNPALK